MKNHNLLVLLTLSLLYACNSSSTSTTQNDATKIEAISQTDLEKKEKLKLPFIEDNFSKITFPLQIDTVDFEGKNKLSTDFVIELEKMVNKDENRYALQLASFIKLNKLEKGQDPVESGNFDIGESIAVTYYDMGSILLEEQKTWIAFMGVEYESYPACPWGNGSQIVLVTFNTEGKLVDLFTIAENSEGGDPPVWGKGQKKVYSQNGIEYVLSIKNSYGEDDDDGKKIFEEITKQTQKITIESNGKLKIEEPQKE